MANDVFSPRFVPPVQVPSSETLSPTQNRVSPDLEPRMLNPQVLFLPLDPVALALSALAEDARAKVEAAYNAVGPLDYDQL